MKLKKLLIASAVVAAVAGAMSTAAFAEGDFDVTYEDGTVTLGAYTEIATDNTMVIVDTAEDGSRLSEINEENIHQINQQAGAYTVIPVGELEDGTYEVRIGGDGNLYSATFTVGGGGESTRLLGDVTGDGEINTLDSGEILSHYTGRGVLEGDDFKAADVNKSNSVDTLDSGEVLSYYVGRTSVIDGVTTISQ
ncbi:MAG TPA: dockerin type I repeat-containing protein [Candidatus Ornithomonoglobus intestinigallinarum]|uniref:Dockerin type I repeat-containing protein n=1 Tax=Candidatus Ornithomonoglobus intestinigallinarum TaxID=2840894 RepID=A0A9D1H4D0_9FIRM|nr:dockerin type I repeat-containing protein [Candidatus Ornithomonoglobus intestinigallinarum]